MLRLPTAIRRTFSRRSPALVVTLILAPAVGLNASLAHLVGRLMFRQVPGVSEPARLVEVGGLPYSEFADVLRGSRTMDIAAYAMTTADLPEVQAGRALRLVCASPNYFSVLGVRTVLGRTFSPSTVAEATSPVVISHSLWQRVFGGDAQVVGRSLALKRRLYTVVGVAAADFDGVGTEAAEAWVPLVTGGENCSAFGSLGAPNIAVIGRLRVGITAQQAAAEWTAFGSGTPVEHRTVEPILTTNRWRLRRDRDILGWLGGGAVIVLLMACSNAAGLFSMSAMQRRREIAVRYSLGASRGRIAGLLLAESVAAALLCASAAWCAAQAADSLVGRFFPLPPTSYMHAGLWVIAGAFATMACVLSGVLPAFRAAGEDFAKLLKTDSLGGDSGRRNRSALLVGQVAIAFALLLIGGLFVRSVSNLRSGLGYDIDRTVAITLDPSRSAYDGDDDIQPVREAASHQLRANPVVTSVALASNVPFNGSSVTLARRDPRSPAVITTQSFVSWEFVRTIGGTLLKGRDLTSSDVAGSRAVAVVSDVLARDLWASADVVGRCVFIGQSQECTEVVGVVQAMRSRQISKPEAAVFVPLPQGSRYNNTFVGRTLLVRLKGGQSRIGALQGAVREVAPQVAAEIAPLSALTDPFTRGWRLGAASFGLVGALTFVLALVGVYCSLSLVVRQRTPEIGVRLALGATQARIFGMTIRHGLGLLTAGWILGAGLALGLSRLVRNLLFGVEAVDALTFAIGTIGIYGVGLAACAIPSWRAARMDAIVSMRTH